MNKTEIDNFVSTVAKTSAEAQAMQSILLFKHDKAISQTFGSLGAFLEHQERPEESPYRIHDSNGRTEISRNTHRKPSPLTVAEANQTWLNSAQVRMEFGSLAVYQAYIQAAATGKCKTFRAVA